MRSRVVDVAAARSGCLAPDEAGFAVDDAFLNGYVDRLAGLAKIHFHLSEGTRLVRIHAFVLGTEYQRTAFARRRSLDSDLEKFWTMSPEDLLLHKLLADRPRDRSDVADLLLVTGPLDHAYLNASAAWLQRVPLAHEGSIKINLEPGIGTKLTARDRVGGSIVSGISVRLHSLLKTPGEVRLLVFPTGTGTMAIDPLDRYLVRVDVNGYFPGIGYICEASTAPPTDGVTVILKRTIDVEGTFIGSETPSGAGWLYLQSGTELQTLGSSQCDHLVRDGIPPAARLGGSTRVTSRGTFLLHAVRSGYMRAEWVPDFGVGPRIVELMIPEPPGRVEVQLGK